MASRRRAARTVPLCAYCGLQPGTTADHVIPRCLFPSPLPPTMVTVPACPGCHNEKSRNDDYLRDMLVMDADSQSNPVARRLFSGPVTRSARRNSSLVSRAARQAIDQRMQPRYTRGGLYLGHYWLVDLENDRVTAIFEKIVQGLYYRIRSERLNREYIYQVWRIDPVHANDAVDQMHRMSQAPANGPYYIGDVFGCLFRYADEDPSVTFWLLWFYHSIVYAVATTAPDRQDDE